MKPKKLKKENYILQEDRRIEDSPFAYCSDWEHRAVDHNYQGETKTLLIELDPQPYKIEPSPCELIITWGWPDPNEPKRIAKFQSMSELKNYILANCPHSKNEIIILEDDWFTDYDHSGGATTDLSRMQEYYGPEDVLPSTTMPSHLNNFKIIHIIGVESLLPEYWEPGYSHYESDKKWFLKTIVEIEDE